VSLGFDWRGHLGRVGRVLAAGVVGMVVFAAAAAASTSPVRFPKRCPSSTGTHSAGLEPDCLFNGDYSPNTGLLLSPSDFKITASPAVVTTGQSVSATLSGSLPQCHAGVTTRCWLFVAWGAQFHRYFPPVDGFTPPEPRFPSSCGPNGRGFVGALSCTGRVGLTQFQPRKLFDGRYIPVGAGLQIYNQPPGAGGFQVANDYVETALKLSAPCKGMCPLKVSVETFGSDTAGLGSDRSQSPAIPEFLASDTQTTGLGEGTCLSGCRNVQVTVTDKKTGATVEGADVSASVTRFPPGGIAPYPTGFESDDGHLCRADRPSSCGSTLTDLPPTDKNGHVRFLYWAPGAISRHTVKITLKAQKACAACSHGQQTGEDTQRVTTSPHLIYSSESTPTVDDAALVTDWGKDDGFFSAATLRDHAIDQLLEDALGLVVGELEAKAGATAISKISSILTERGQQQRFTALFVRLLGLVPDGLGSVDAGALDDKFVEAIAGKNGLVRRYGAKLEQLARRGIGSNKQLMKLRIFEVSYCKDGEKCGPGDSTPGVESFLYFDFQAGTPPSIAQLTGEHFPEFTDQFVLPYDASSFDLVQFNGKGPPA
jgi:hypothetical protein